MTNVLVIDDQESIINGLKFGLMKNNFKVKTSQSALEALPLIKNEYFDFIITDLKLPGMSGLELVKKCREQGLKTKFIIISAYFTVDDAIEAMRANVMDLFPKPFNVSEIIKRLFNLQNEPDLLTEQKNPGRANTNINRFKAVRSIDESIHVLNYYNENPWSYNSYKISDDVQRYVFIHDESQYLKGFLDGCLGLLSKQTPDFNHLCDIIEKELNIKPEQDKGFVLFEMNFTHNSGRYFIFGNKSFSIYDYGKRTAVSHVKNKDKIDINPGCLFILQNGKSENNLKFENDVLLSEDLSLGSTLIIPDFSVISRLAKHINGIDLSLANMFFYNVRKSDLSELTLDFKITDKCIKELFLMLDVFLSVNSENESSGQSSVNSFGKTHKEDNSVNHTEGVTSKYNTERFKSRGLKALCMLADWICVLREEKYNDIIHLKINSDASKLVIKLEGKELKKKVCEFINKKEKLPLVDDIKNIGSNYEQIVLVDLKKRLEKVPDQSDCLLIEAM